MLYFNLVACAKIACTRRILILTGPLDDVNIIARRGHILNVK